MKDNVQKRRDFIKQVSALSIGLIVAPQLSSALREKVTNVGDGYTFLFQGDSITDGNRTHNNDWNHVMGHGYAYLIASRLWYDFPKKKFHFFNRGVSGNKVPDLTVRWQQDAIDIKPDLLSILIGVNDTTALINGNAAFTAEKFENDYRLLLQQTKIKLPGVQLILCEPFILQVGNVKEHWNEYNNEMQKRQKIVRQLSLEFNAIFIPFQEVFNKALSKAPADYWIWDGVHPMPAGHELMAREWIKQVSKKLPFIK